ncbi:MAG: hypothetical protein AB7U63_08445 [Porticoccaceae bacterium]
MNKFLAASALAILTLSLSIVGTIPVTSYAETTRAPAKAATKAVEPALQVMRAERSTPKQKMFAAPDGGSHEWKCTEYDTGTTSCECKGMLDCKKLIDSGKCAGKSSWEAGDDPSVGGCDG